MISRARFRISANSSEPLTAFEGGLEVGGLERGVHNLSSVQSDKTVRCLTNLLDLRMHLHAYSLLVLPSLAEKKKKNPCKWGKSSQWKKSGLFKKKCKANSVKNESSRTTEPSYKQKGGLKKKKKTGKVMQRGELRERVH